MRSGGVTDGLEGLVVQRGESALTMLTEAAGEVLRTGAQCGGAVRDLDADSSVLTGVGPTRSTDSARRMDRN